MTNAHRNPTLGTHFIYDGDDLALLDELEEKVKQAKDAPTKTRTLGEPDAYTAAVEQYNTALADAKTRAKKVVLREIGRKKRRELIEACPVREGNEADEILGANTDMLSDALLDACIASPIFSTDVERDEFIESLGSRWFDKLSREAYSLNFGGAPAPKELLPLTPTSNAI